MRILEAKITSPDGVQLTTEPCPFCGKRHYHGSAGETKGFEHRLAHCVKGGPMEGYYIRWGGAEISKEMKCPASV
jgi:hypothetical protein